MSIEFIQEYLPLYQKAMVLTLKIGWSGIVLAILAGFVCAMIQYYKVPILRQIVAVYIELSRNTPLLIQLFFLYYGLPKIGIATNAEVCGVAGMVFLGGSYMAETFRSGLEAIDKVQTESAYSLGMTKKQTLAYIILPQAMSVSVPAFTANVIFLLKETSVFSAISLISIVISLPLGILLGVIMTWKNPVTKFITRIYLEIIRIMPQMVLLFIVFFGTTRIWGWNLSGEISSIIVFAAWGTAEMGDLVRSALISIPRHQYESAQALGFNWVQTYVYFIIPQTVRRLLPLSINLITRMIKTTSLVLMIGVVEMMKVAQQIIEANRMTSPNAAFGLYLVTFLLYFIVCWPISMLARYLEKKWNS